MSDKLQDAITAYIEQFDEGPPIFDMEEDEAILSINEALESGKPLEEGLEKDIPDGALL